MWIDDLKYPEQFEDVLRRTLELNPTFEIKSKVMPMDIIHVVISGYNDNPMSRRLLGNEQILENITSRCYIKNNFKKYKQIYLVNEAFRKKLTQTAGLESISTEMLYNLPYDFFYLQLQYNSNVIVKREKLEGCFVAREKYSNKFIENEFLVLVLKLEHGYVPLKLKMGQTVQDSIEEVWSKENVLDNERKELQKVFYDLLQIVIYMCSVNPDIKKVRKSGTQKKNKKKEKPIDYFELGYILGATFGATKYVYEDDSSVETVKDTQKRIHFRRPHWATYHVGKGRTETIVKWIDTILVNGKGNEDELDVIVHKIK